MKTATAVLAAAAWLAGCSVTTSQDVVDFLSQPLPVPDGAKPLLLPRDSGKFGGNDSIAWHTDVAFDVTDMTPEEIAAIGPAYWAYLGQQFPLQFHYTERGNIRRPPGDQYGFEDGIRMGWTWNWSAKGYSQHYNVDIYADVMDLEPQPPPSILYNRHPVADLNTPVRGQRVLWMRLVVTSKGLPGSGKWPG